MTRKTNTLPNTYETREAVLAEAFDRLSGADVRRMEALLAKYGVRYDSRQPKA